MTDTPERRAIISGIGISKIGRKTGIPGVALTEEACRAAVSDAGLELPGIDGLASMGETPLIEASRALGLRPAWEAGGAFGKGGLLAPVMTAVAAVASGAARHVLVYRTVQMMGGTILPADAAPAEAEVPSVMGDMAPMLTYHAYSAANWLAMHCRRHMYLYGTTKEQLGHLAINSRRYAALNPRAAYR
jgi:acetyl-CoA acetyltransferase